MLSEIYCKVPWDPTYQENMVVHSDIYESVLQKVRMILHTKPGEVLGNPHFGVDLEQYVFSMNSSNFSIQKVIEDQIYQFIPEAQVVDISVNVRFMEGETSDTCFVDIKIQGTDAMTILLQ